MRSKSNFLLLVVAGVLVSVAVAERIASNGKEDAKVHRLRSNLRYETDLLGGLEILTAAAAPTKAPSAHAEVTTKAPVMITEHPVETASDGGHDSETKAPDDHSGGSGEHGTESGEHGTESGDHGEEGGDHGEEEEGGHGEEEGGHGEGGLDADEECTHLYEFACVNFEARFKTVLAFIVLLIVITHIFERALSAMHRVIHRFKEPIFKKVFSLALEEITITGGLSFALFLFEVYLPLVAPPNEEVHDLIKVFEFLHMMLFVTVIIYVPFIMFIAWQRQYYVTEWTKFEAILTKTPYYVTINQWSETEKRIVPITLDESYILGSGATRRYNYFVGARKHFLMFHDLPSTFPYTAYLSDCFDLLFTKFTKLSYRIGFVFFLWLAVGSILHPLFRSTEHSKTSRNLYLFLSGVIINVTLMILCSVSMFKVKKIADEIVVEAHDLQRDQLLDTHRASLIVSAPMSFQAYLNQAKEVIAHKVGGHRKFKHFDSAMEDLYDGDARMRERSEVLDRMNEERNNRNWKVKYLPYIFERNPYRRKFPFASPNFHLRLFQTTLIFQALFLFLFFFVFDFIGELTSRIGLLWLLLSLIPTIFFVFYFAPRCIPILAIVRYSGPVSKLSLIHRHFHDRVGDFVHRKSVAVSGMDHEQVDHGMQELSGKSHGYSDHDSSMH